MLGMDQWTHRYSNSCPAVPGLLSSVFKNSVDSQWIKCLAQGQHSDLAGAESRTRNTFDPQSNNLPTIQ